MQPALQLAVLGTASSALMGLPRARPGWCCRSQMDVMSHFFAVFPLLLLYFFFQKTLGCFFFSDKWERFHPIPGILLEEVQMTSSQKTLSAAEIRLQEPSSSLNHKQRGQRIAWRILKCHETPAPHRGPISHHGEGHHFSALLSRTYTNMALLHVGN